MRTVSSAQNSILTSGAMTTKYRVFVDSTGAGVYVDLTNYLGIDWLGDVTWGDDVDSPVQQASIKVARASHDLSLSPWMGSSKLNNGAPLIDAGRRFYLETATVAYNAEPQSGEWVRAFEGYIDDISAAEFMMELSCRDLSCVLVDTFIEVQRYYANTATALTTVMQAIIDDNIVTPGIAAAIDVNLYTPVAPTFLVNRFLQEKQSVWEALTTLANLIGWDLRYRWDSGTSRFRLTFQEPKRTSPVVLRTFGPDDYYTVPTLKISRADVRNAGQLVFGDSATGLRSKVNYTDTASIAKYKRRFFEFCEGAVSQIRNSADASSMLVAAVKDLSTPKMEHSYGMDYFFAAEVGDYYAFTANGVHYDSTQQAAVVSVRHTLSSESGTAETVLGMRGFPCSGVRKWLRVEGRPGVGPTADFIDPDAPSGVLATAALGSVVIVYDPPDKNNWDCTEVYMDTAGIADPGVNSEGKRLRPGPGFLVAKGKQTKFSIDSLVPGTTYYGRILVVDKNGNVGPVSGQFTVETERAGPYHQNLDGAQAILNPNADFNIFTKGTSGWPDAWGPADANDIWGTGKTTYFDVNAASGKFCLTLWTGLNGGGLVGVDTPGGPLSDFIPFAAGEVYTAAAWVKWANPIPAYGGPPVLSAVLYVKDYDANKNIIGTRLLTVESSASAPSPGSWYLGFLGHYHTQLNSNTRYIRVGLARYGSAFAPFAAPWGYWDPGNMFMPAIGLYIDRIAVMRGLPRCESDYTALATSYLYTGTTFYPVPTGETGVYIVGFLNPDAGTNYTEWMCNLACTADVHFTAEFQAMTDGTSMPIWVDLYDPAAGTWTSGFGGDAVFTADDDGQFHRISIQALGLDIPSGGLLRIICISNHDVRIKKNSIQFKVTATSRRDLL